MPSCFLPHVNIVSPFILQMNFNFDGGRSGTYRGHIRVSDQTMHGTGTLKFSCGQMHEGEWRAGLADGQGRRVWPSGQEYVGQWCNGQMNGQGCCTWPKSSHKFEGQHSKGMSNGLGTMHYPDGSVFCGQWRDDQPNGQGRYTLPDGTFVEGMFSNGVFPRLGAK